MNFKKLLSVLTLTFVLATSLASCDGSGNEQQTEAPTQEVEKTPAELESAALAYLEANPYKIEMNMSYSSDNDYMNTIYQSMSTESAISVNGKNCSVVTEAEGMSTTMTYVDSTVYMDLLGTKIKAEVSAEDESAVISDIAGQAEFELAASDFVTLEKTKNSDGSYTVKCIGINENAVSKLASIVGEDAEAMGIEIDNESLNYEFTVDADGKMKSQSLALTMNMSGDLYGMEDFSVSVESTIEYSYGDVTVSAPSDADSYELMDFDDIYGE